MKRALKLHSKDSVAVVIDPVKAGDQVHVENQVITALSDIPVPHKIAITDLAPDQNVYKYGAPIGYATQTIKVGDYVHNHNLDLARMIEALANKQTIN